MKLTDKEWDTIILKEIFRNYHGKRLVKQKRINGKIPLLTASENNQGVSSFICNNDMISFKDFISIDMFGQSFYHSYRCFGDDNIYFFKNNNISYYSKLFITSCINKNKFKYSYGNQFRQNNADKDKILLPIKENKKPDFQFMEKHIKNIIQKKYNEYINYSEKIINNLKRYNIEPLQKKEWGKFFIEDIFKIFSGKRLTKENMKNGNIPFLGASEANNGITQFVSNKNESYDKNVLGVNYNGSVGEAFYHPYNCIFSDDVKRFHLKKHHDNKYVLLFLSLIIRKQKEKYSYGYKFNETRMLRQYILLPLNHRNEPDYEYMEKYTQNKMLQKYEEYLKYIKKAAC